MPEDKARRSASSAHVGALLRRARHRAERRADDESSPEAGVDRAQRPQTRPHMSTLITDFLRPNRSQAIMAVILFVTALLIVTGVRARNADTDFSTMRRADLIQMLDTLNADSQKLSSEINDLKRTKERLESGVDSAQVAADEAKKRLSAMQILAGTAPAVGPGVRITIYDPGHKVGPELVLDAIEEMRDAGAEVMQLNGQIRIVASTWFGRSSDGQLSVNGEVVTFPLVLEAIGDPATLEAGARFRGGLVSEVQNERVGGTVSITQVKQLSITALASVSVPQYSRPA